MNVPILSRNSSLYSSQSFQSKKEGESEDRKSTLAGSTNYEEQNLNRSGASVNNSRLYSSAASYNTNIFSQESIIDEKHQCKAHSRRFSYTCLNCNQNVCSGCLLDPLQHRGHRFQRYSDKKEDLRLMSKKLSAQINFNKGQLYNLIDLAQSNKQEKQEQKKTKIQKLEIHNNKMKQLGCQQINRIENEISSYKTVLKQFNQFYQCSLMQLNNTNKIALISQMGSKIAQNILSKTAEVSQSKIIVPKSNFQQCIKPSFYSNMFTICNFTQLKKACKQKIFQPFQAYQSLWRLKVYPGGYLGAKMDEKKNGVQYMSVYAQRIDGLLESSHFIIQIETTSRIDPRLKIKKQFKSEFAKNQSWGYDRYTRLTNIYEHGFLGQDDTLFLKISICPVNYFQASRALNQIITQKLRIQQQNERKIKILKVLLQKKRQSQSETLKNQKDHVEMIFIEPISTQESKINNISNATQFIVKNGDQGGQEEQQQIKEEQKDFKIVPLNQSSSVFRQQRSSRMKDDLKEKISQRAGGLGISRNRTSHYPSISLQKRSPSKLIRLVSLKNVELIESSRKKLHNRSSTHY